MDMGHIDPAFGLVNSFQMERGSISEDLFIIFSKNGPEKIAP